MTLVPSDSPDWTTIPGAGRFLGKITVTLPGAGSATAGIAVVPASYDGAFVLVTAYQSIFPQYLTSVSVFEATTGTQALDVTEWSAELGPLVAPVSLAVGSDWRINVTLTGTAADVASVWVFAVPSYQAVVPAVINGKIVRDAMNVYIAEAQNALAYGWNVAAQSFDRIQAVGGALAATLKGPLGRLASAASIAVAIASDQPIGSAGQAVRASSAPVTIASDQGAGRTGQNTLANGVPVSIASDQAIGKAGAQTKANSAPVVLPTDQPVGTGGQAVMASSVPVVIASDQTPVATGARRPYDSMLFHRPAAATQATITFAATAGKRWCLDFAMFELRCAAATAAQLVVEIVDGAAALYQDDLSVGAVADGIDRAILGPMLGYIGTVNTAMIVRFQAAGPANTGEVVAAAAYLIT